MTIDRKQAQAAFQVCACLNLRRASRAVTRLYDEALERGGLRSTQFVALVAIRADEDPTLPRLARALGLDRSTLTRNLQPLVRGGLVTTTTGRSARTSRAALTLKGERMLESCVPYWQAAQRDFESRLGAERWAALLEGLGQAANASREA